MIVSPCRDMLHSAKSTNFCKYVTIIVKMSLQPDGMASRVGFGPLAVVWRLLLYSIGVMNGSYIVICYYVLYILSGS